jgi:hypothetical protein
VLEVIVVAGDVTVDVAARVVPGASVLALVGVTEGEEVAGAESGGLLQAIVTRVRLIRIARL